MENIIEENIWIILSVLYNNPKSITGINGEKLQELTNLSPSEINDAVSILERDNYVEALKFMGTAPFRFGTVKITSAGKFEYEQVIRITEEMKNIKSKTPRVNHKIVPVGSPYGFQDEDWEKLSSRKSQTDILNVVFGYQFKSSNYNIEQLKRNLQNNFCEAINNYNNLPDAIPIKLNFKPLAAGYGEHLFNEIARDIISSDIAVFDTSDLNPNVMLEMGVALTWGIRVLPIKKEGCPKPPSDISGQTWADYRDSGDIFIDNEHIEKLNRMVERAARKKSKL